MICFDSVPIDITSFFGSELSFWSLKNCDMIFGLRIKGYEFDHECLKLFWISIWIKTPEGLTMFKKDFVYQ